MHYTLSMAKVQWALKNKKTHKIRRGDSAQLGNTSKSVVPDNSTSNSDCRITEKNGKKKQKRKLNNVNDINTQPVKKRYKEVNVITGNLQYVHFLQPTLPGRRDHITTPYTGLKTRRKHLTIFHLNYCSI